jgi:hypothetical protein
MIDDRLNEYVKNHRALRIDAFGDGSTGDREGQQKDNDGNDHNDSSTNDTASDTDSDNKSDDYNIDTSTRNGDSSSTSTSETTSNREEQGHEASINFLRTEVLMLRKVKSSVITLIDNLRLDGVPVGKDVHELKAGGAKRGEEGGKSDDLSDKSEL